MTKKSNKPHARVGVFYKTAHRLMRSIIRPIRTPHGLTATLGIVLGITCGLLLGHPTHADATAQLPPATATIDMAAQVAPITPAETLPPLYIEQFTHLNRGEVLSQALNKADLPLDEIYAATHEISKVYSLRNLKPGELFSYAYRYNGKDAPGVLEGITLYSPADKIIKLRRDGSNFECKVAPRTLVHQTVVKQGTIKSSLYQAADDIGMPDGLVEPFVNLFVWDIDFTRDLRRGDHFQVAYDVLYDKKGRFVRYGDIMGATLSQHDGTVFDAFRAPNGDYYDHDGHNKRKALMRTPLKFTRISSPFQLARKHPILGFTRAHKGTDFAAPMGTPVKAAGDGKVVAIGWVHGYGRYIRIRHNHTFQTAYAHLSRYARGLRSGSHVRQGQVIAYVGMSGLATGPHLHYEVLINGTQVNAMTVKLPKGAPLPARYRASFKTDVAAIEHGWANHTEVARNNAAPPTP